MFDYAYCFECEKTTKIEWIMFPYVFKCRECGKQYRETFPEIIKNSEVVNVVNVHDIYSGGKKFLNFEIAKKEKLFDKKLTIETVEVQEINEKQKIVIGFKETDYALVLNKTNADILAEEISEETDEWINQKIKLTKGKTTYKGKPVNCIIVEV